MNSLAINQPKSSKLNHGQVSGQSSYSCNLGKNIPELQQVHLGKETAKQRRHFDRANDFNMLGQDQFKGSYKPPGVDSPNSSANLSDCFEEELKPDRLAIMSEVLRGYSPEQM